MWRRLRLPLFAAAALIAACSGSIIFYEPYAPDSQAPTTPTNLQAVAYAGAVYLSWDVSSDNVGVEAYSITRLTVPATTPAYFVTAATSYTDSSVGSGVQYCYSVTAVDYQHNSSAPSSSACVTAP